MFHADVAGIQAIPPELYLMLHTNNAIPKIALCTMRERMSGWAPLRRGIRRIGELPTAPKSRRPKTIRLRKISAQIMTSHRTMIKKKTTLTLPHRIASDSAEETGFHYYICHNLGHQNRNCPNFLCEYCHTMAHLLIGYPVFHADKHQRPNASGALRRERHGKAGRGEKWMN